MQDCPSVVSADVGGNLTMHQFPCTSANAQYITYKGHLGPVGKSRWMPGKEALISTDAEDNAIMIWRQDIDKIFDDHFDTPSSASAQESTPFLSDKMPCYLALYNFSGQRVIHPSSGNCVVFDRLMNCRDSFQSHETTVMALCTSSSRQLLASSDAEVIRVWDSQTCTEVAMLIDDRHQKISTLSFSPDDTKLVCLSSDEHKQIICVWITLNGEWSRAFLAFHTLAGPEKVNFTFFNATQNDNLTLVSFWLEQHSTLVVTKGALSKECAKETFVCSVPLHNKLLVMGTKSGLLI